MVLPIQPPPFALPGLPQSPAPVDPEAILELGEAVQKAIEEQINLATKPVYPSWYNPDDYQKPEPGKALARIRELEADFAAYRTRVAQDLKVARMDVAGVFKDFDAEKEDPWIDFELAGEIELIASQLADSELAFDAPARTRSEEGEAGRKIDFAIACKEEQRRQHSRAGNGPLDLDIARMLLLTGRLAWHVQLNLDAEEDEMPFIEQLVDPCTCFPVFEAQRGIKIMGRTYTMTLGDAIGAFETKENKLSKLLEGRGPDGRFVKRCSETDIVEICEYWDRRWRVIFMDGRVIIGPVEHGYGFVPFVYKLGGLGMPATLRDPALATHRDLGGFKFVQGFHGRDAAQPHKGIGLVTLLRLPHQLREAVMTKMLTAFSKSIDPPLLVAMDDITYSKGVPEISRAKAALNPIRLNRHDITAVPTDPSPTVMGPILQGIADNQSRGMLPPTAHGQNDKSNVAGYATNVLNEAGLTKTVWAKQTIEEFEAECMEMRLRLFRDWGHLIRQGTNSDYGVLRIPRFDAMPDEDRTVELTPGDLRRTGIRMKVTMSNIPVQMLGPIGNAVNIWMGMGLMDKLTALKLRKDPNPHRTLRRVELDQALDDDAIKELRVIEGLLAEGMEAAAQYYVARKLERKMAEQMEPMMGGGQLAGMGMGADGPVQTVVGDSNAMYGQGPGPGSGPQGPIGAPPLPGNEP